LFIDVLGVHRVRIPRSLLLFQEVVEPSLSGKTGAFRPLRLQRDRHLRGLPWLLGDDANKVLLHDDLHEAWHAVDGALVHAPERRAHFRWTDDTPVEHPWHADVMHELEPAGHERRDIKARNRLAEDCPLTHRLALRVRIEREVEFPAADEFGVREA